MRRSGPARRATTPRPPLLVGPQDYVPVDAALPSGVNFGPAERARMVKQSLDICQKKGVLGSGYIPKVYQTTCTANSKGLFAYYQYAEAGFILTCRTKDGGGSGWAGITGVKDISADRSGAPHRDRRGQGAQEPEAARDRAGPLHRDPRAAASARFLSLMTGLFNARTAEGPVGNYFSGKERGTTKVGEKLFSEQLTLKSDIGNPILRQSPIGTDGLPARDVTWVDKGVLKTLYYDRPWATRQKKDPTPATTNKSLVMEGSNLTLEEMIKTTRRGLLVTFFWYIRPVDQPTLLNTGMTRDGLFLIENGEIAGPVQNFRWNMSPLVGFNNITARRHAGADSHRRVLRRPGHGAGAAGPDRRLLHDVGIARGVMGMSMKRRDFVKTVALSGMAVAASDLVGELIAQTPQGKVLESKFKGLADVALAEAKRTGCTYADIRFTRRTNSASTPPAATVTSKASAALAAGVAAGAADGAAGAVGAAAVDSAAPTRPPDAARPASACG